MAYQNDMGGEAGTRIRQLEEALTKLSNRITMVESSFTGLQMSLKALADSNEIAVEKITAMEEGKSSVGYDALINAVNSIATEIASGVDMSKFKTGEQTTLTPPKKTQAPPRAKSGDKTDPMPVDLDVADIDWMVKGNQPAPDNARFAYAFVYEQNSTTIKDAVRNVYAACLQFGEIETADGYTIKISGDKNNLLSRTPTKKKSG